jgi:hypothetical protein
MIKLLLILVMSGAFAGALAPSDPPLLIQDTAASSLDASN